MSASFLDDDRIVDLLVTRTVEGLDEREEAELRGFQETRRDSMPKPLIAWPLPCR